MHSDQISPLMQAQLWSNPGDTATGDHSINWMLKHMRHADIQLTET